MRSCWRRLWPLPLSPATNTPSEAPATNTPTEPSNTPAEPTPAEPETGGEPYEKMFSGSTTTVFVAANVGAELYADMPTELYELIAVNDEATGTSVEYYDDYSYLMLSFDIIDAEGEEIPWDYIRDSVLSAGKDFANVYGIADYELIDGDKKEINGTEWTLYCVGGSDKNYAFYGVVCTELEDEAGFVLIYITYTANCKAAVSEISAACSEIVNSMNLYQ